MRVVILTVVLATVLSVNAKQTIGTQRNVCTGIADGTFFADETSCSNFFVCYQGEAVIQSCNRGSYFERSSSYCLPDTQNICNQTECAVDNVISAHPTDCSLFYVCYNGKLVEQSCETGSYFDSTVLYCVPDTQNICPESSPDRCSVEGALSENPTNCSAFYICYEGKLVEQSCENGSYFDSTNLYCTPDTDNVCKQPQCSVEGAFSPHPTDCSLFYVCYNGLLVEEQCGNGSYFDKVNLFCTPDVDNICWPSTPCTCVGGYTDGEFVASPDSCYSYYVCSDGELVEQNCGNGNYFNNSTRRCEIDTTGECWPSSTTCTEGDLTPSPNNCSSFFVCTQGELIEQSCGTGNYFDNCTKICEPDNDGRCWPAVTPCSCPGGYNEADLVANSDSCSSFFVCTQGELVAQSCGTGNYFDLATKACEADNDGRCWPAVTPCSCPGGYNEGDLVANSDSCSSFFVCTQGELVAQSCGTGNYFDLATKACEADNDGRCWPAVTPCSCPGGYNEGDLVANSDSCSSFFVCTQGELVAQSCGTGNYFDLATKACEADNDGRCWPAVTPCSCPGGYNEGDLVANSDSCSSFFVCTQGELVAQSCGTGNYFDLTTKTCETDQNGTCWPISSSSSSTSTSTTTTTTTTPATGECSGGLTEGELVPSDRNCSSYFVCVDGELQEQDCGIGNYFDAKTLNCVQDDNSTCWTPATTTEAPCECPGGYEDGELVPSDRNCSSYFICVQGELIEQDCEAGNYFDANSTSCVRDVDGICWPITSSSTSTTTTEAPFECPGGYEDGELVPSDRNCSSYFVCVDGELQEQDCGIGNYFDAKSLNCVQDDNSTCWTAATTTEAPCECPGGYEDGELVPSDRNCSSYFICVQGELIEQDCEAGNYFDANSTSCVRDVDGICWPITSSSTSTSSTSTSSTSTTSTTTEAPCECPGGYEDGELVPSDRNCSSYFICVQGELIEQDCEAGNYFDANSTSCVRDVDGICWPITSSSTSTSSTSTSSTSTTSTTTEAPYECPGGYEDGELVPSDRNCSSYFICVQGELIEQDCEAGNYFDANSTSCVRDVDGICWPITSSSTSTSSTSTSSTSTTSTSTTSTTTEAPCECPGGYEDGELVPSDRNCSSYFICVQGELIEQDCEAGNYFDANSTSCVRDVDGICWPITSSSTSTSSTSTSSTSTSSTSTTSTTTETPCECPGGYEDGELVPSDRNCSSYFICVQGELIERDCGTGNYFDANSTSCVRDVDGICWPITSSSTSTSSTSTSSTSTTSTSTTSTTTEAPCECPGGYEDGELVPSDRNCSSYFICVQGELIERDCGTGNYFDANSTSCVRDVDGICWPITSSSTSTSSTSTSSTSTTSTTTEAPCECPGGYEDGELVPSDRNCSSYFICVQGELIEQDCEAGNYFDANSTSCVRDVDGICWPITSSSTSTSSTSTSSTSTSSTSTTSTTTEAPCECPGGYEDGELVPSDRNCSSYFICVQGELIERDCGTGNYFDANSTSCVRDVDGICWPITSSSTSTSSTSTSSTSTTSTTTEAPCECPGGYEDGELVPSDRNCSSYFICVQGELIEQDCEAGNYFDANSTSCVRDVDGICWPITSSSTSTSSTSTSSTSTSSTSTTSTTTETPCECPGGYEDGELVPSDRNCSSYFICVQGELIERDCGTGNYFDANSTSCVRDVDGICWPITSSSTSTSSTSTSSTSTTSTSTTSTTTEAPCECPGGYEDGELVPSDRNCSSYFICVQGELIERDCGTGNYFDANSTSCVRDVDGICWPITSSSTSTSSTSTSSTSTTSTTTEAPCECPGGYEDGELVPSDRNCSSYFICVQGELIEQDCEAGNYFDANSTSCVRDVDGICWPITSSSTSTSSTSTSSTSTTSTSTTSTTTEAPCNCLGGYEDGELVPSDRNCSSYSICVQGELIERDCGTGNYFDANSTSCVRDVDGICWPITSSSTSTSSTSSTSTSTTSTTPEAPCGCPGGYEDGEFIPFPDSCHKFYICYNGELYEDSCGYGNYFDGDSSSCVLDKTGVCWQITTTPSTTTPSTTTPSTTTPSTTTPSTTTPSTTTPSTTTPSTTTPSTTTPSTTTPSTTTPSTTTPSTTTPSTTTPSTTTPSTTTPSTTTPSTTTTSTTTQPPCVCPGGYEDGEFIPFPDSCFKFYICYNGELVEESCGYGNYFDADSSSCVLDKTGVCWQITTTPSTTTPSTTTPSTTTPSTTTPSTTTPSTTTPSTTTPSTTTPSTTTPSTTTPSTTTPSTTTPSTTTPSTTTPSTTTPSTTTQPPCVCPGGYEDGEFIPFPDSCFKFYICYNGELVEESCGYGNYFDADSSSCVLDKTGVCWQITTTPSTTPPSTTPSTTTSSTTTPSTSTPSKTTSSTTTPSTTTPSTTTPSTTTSSTTTPSTSTPSTTTPSTSSVEPCTCPGGYDAGEFIPNPDSCYMFYVCYQGELLEVSCGFGNFFDEGTKSCVLDTTGICWSTSTSTSTSTTTTTSTTSVPCTCPGGYENGDFIGSSNCASFSICYQGEFVEMSCGEGNYFNNLTKSCVSDTEGICWTQSTTSTPCPDGYQEGELITNPSACSMYYICIAGQILEGDCGTKNYFNNETKSCEADTDGSCWPVIQPPVPAPTPCECPNGLQEGQLTGSPSGCHLYNICLNGALVEGNCGTGNYFNNATNACEIDNGGCCWPVTTSPVPTPPGPTPCACPNGLAEGQLSGTPTGCHLYNICLNGALVEGNCGTGNYFNNATNACEVDNGGCCWPVTTSPVPTPPAPTPCACPNGLGEGQLSGSSTGCHLYNVCLNGELVEGNCGTGNYFNNATNACEVDNGGCCWPVTTSPVPTPPGPTPCACPNGLAEGQLSGTPTGCHLYNICLNGALVEGNCGTGNYFNNATNACEVDNGGCCWPVTTSPVPTPPAPTPCACPNGLGEGQLSGTPTGCHLYNICLNGELVEGNCGTGNFFNNATNACEVDNGGCCWPVTSSTVPTPPAPTPCACPNGLAEGQLSGSSTGCHLYNICLNGELVEGNCGAGNYFNNATNACEVDNGGCCWPVTTSPVPTPPAPTPCACPNGLAEGQLSGTPTGCHLYNICLNGELVEGNCGTGNFFNNATNACEVDNGGCCWPVTTSPVPTPPAPTPCACPNGLAEGQLSGTPTGCHLYNICLNGELVEGNCGTGNFFNNATNACEVDNGGCCWPVTSSPVPTPPAPTPCACPNGLEEGQLTGSPSGCHLYNICINGELVEGSCGTGNYFNNATNACEVDSGGCCWPIVQPPVPVPSPCECPNGLQEGQLTGSPSGCHLYNICINGELVEGSCGTGNYFNNATNACEVDSGGCCWSIVQPPLPAPSPCECPNGLQEGQLTGSPSGCHLYNICINGELVEGSCGTGNYFNNATNACEVDSGGCCWPIVQPPVPVPAPCECPNGLQEGQLTGSPSGCHLYNICINGELVEGSCGTGNYFNNATNACEVDSGGCCWPIVQPPVPVPTPCECPNGLQEGQLTGSPSACYLYNVCQNGEIVEGDCGTGNYFDNTTNACEVDSGGCCWPKNTECPGGYSNGEFVPDPLQCDKFSICYEGALVQQDCGVGYFFDIDNNYCARDINGTCWAVEISNQTCDGVANGTFLPNEASCEKFFVCYNNSQIPQDCGVGNFFDRSTLTCQRDTLGSCWKKIPNVCANAITGTFVASPSNCQEFYVCYQNRAVLQQCGNGNWFNPNLMVCQPDLNATCINVCAGTDTSIGLPHPNCNQFYSCANGLTMGVGTCRKGSNYDATLGICLTTAVCEADICAKSTNGAVYPVLNDLTSFYTCYNQIPVKLSCPDGTSFDPDRLICIPDTGRCVGKKNGYVVASYNNPNAYYVCSHNMAIFEQCPSYAIFDEKQRICVHAQGRRVSNNVCTSEPDGTLLPGNACNKFNLCLDGEVIEQNCGAYSSFNQKLGYCVLNLTCFDQNQICAQSSDVEKFPDARYANSFVKCKGGVGILEKCPKHMIYSHDIGYCVPKEMAMTTTELDEICQSASDNTLAPALDCRKFYICHQQVAILQQCAIDQHFDAQAGTCRPDVERQCWMRSETLRRSFFLKTVCHEGQIRNHPSDCTQFEICKFGIWTAEACPLQHIFDVERQTCVRGEADEMCSTARTVECVDGMPLRASENLCTDYYRCENSRWKAAKCPIGEFFDRKTERCSKDASACVPNEQIEFEVQCNSNETKAADTDCGIFHVCHDGEWWYRHCDQGTYYNRSLSACIPNDGTCRLSSLSADPCRNGTVMKSDFDPCVAYHLCADGNWTVQRCPSSHYFDETRKACMLDDGAQTCQNGIRNTSSSCVDGERRYKATNCTSFEICSFGSWLSVDCRNGFYFDTSLKLCIPNRGECSSDDLRRRECLENTSRPNPSNCSQFFYCSRKKWQLESCQTGLQYNATADKCLAANSSCAESQISHWNRNKCVGLKSGSYLAHEDDCTKYYLCVDDLAVQAECGRGRFFDSESQRCELNNGACLLQALTEDNLCQNRTSGSSVQNPANCTTFYICTDTTPLLSYCPPEQYFNAEIGACQTDTGICNKPRLCDGNPGGRFAHETYCNIFYSCVRGVAIPVACEEDQIFDASSKKCLPDTEHRCVDGILVDDDDICAKVGDGKPQADSNDCSKYFICLNGVAETLQCPAGQFFDTNMMICMPDDGSCNDGSGPNNNNNNTIPPDPITCVGKHGYLMPDPEHCNEFYVCIYGNLRHERCFDGEYFDYNTYSCTPMVGAGKCQTAGEMSTLCVNGAEGESFADQIDCRKYYECNNAQLVSKRCRNGESFDTLLGFCRQSDGTCLLENGQRVGACAGKHGKLAADWENCRGYFTCINGQKISEECDIEEYFDKAALRCEKDVNSTCAQVEGESANTTQLSCAGLTELVFYPNVHDGCKTFFQCVKGVPRVHKCPDDLLFNGETGICEWKEHVECLDMTLHYKQDQVCLNATNGTRYVNSKDNCDSYFICTDGKMKSFKCDQGLKFSTELERCDLAANVNCTLT